MVSELEWHDEGDHRLVTIPTALTTVTFYLSNTNTSSSDSSTAKYFDNFATSATQFSLVADQAIQLIGFNGVTFTDAIPIAANTNYQEDKGDFRSVVVKTTTSNTQISLRVR